MDLWCNEDLKVFPCSAVCVCVCVFFFLCVCVCVCACVSVASFAEFGPCRFSLGKSDSADQLGSQQLSSFVEAEPSGDAVR